MTPEAWGGALLLLSLLTTVFLVGAGGRVGGAIRNVFTFTFGKWVTLVPLALLGIGLVLILGKPSLTKRRLFFGVTLFFCSTLGLFHLLTGAAPLASGVEAVRERGGAVGALTAFPLQRLTGSAATFLILSVGVTAGILTLTRTSLKDFLLAMGDLSKWVGRTYRHRRTHGVPPGEKLSSPVVSNGRVRRRDVSRKKRGRRWKLPGRLGKSRRKTWPIAPVIQVPGPAGSSPSHQPPAPAEQPTPSPPVTESLSDESSPLEQGDTLLGQRELEPEPDPTDQPAGDDVDQPQSEQGRPGTAARAMESGGDSDSTPYRAPPLDLLSRGAEGEGDRQGPERTAAALRQALADHGVDARIVGVVSGPSVTRFEIELAPGVKVQKLSALSNDIAYALATPDVRLLVPIPGRSAIGVEVPNADRRLVRLGDILSGREAEARRHPLVVGLGMDIAGRPFLLNLAELPHLLIAGATGAGKSSCINSILTSLLIRSHPEDLKLILVDPKRVELGQFQGVPHLLTRVITDPKKATEALKWVVAEMDRRYDLLAEAGARDISGYASKWRKGSLDREKFDRFPYLLVVVDELNDLMMVAGREVEMAIVRIAQMARAVGIHLVLATQRPSVNVITGVIKANVPSRLAFSVASQTDSRVIIDSAGAEKLVGRGDMLVVTARQPRPRRVQGAWVEEAEIARVVAWIGAHTAPEDDLGQLLDEALTVAAAEPEPEDDKDEPLVRQAMELVVRSQLGSTSMLQRKLRVGFARAGRLMDILEQRGVVGPSQGSKAREVLISPEELP